MAILISLNELLNPYELVVRLSVCVCAGAGCVLVCVCVWLKIIFTFMLE